MRYKDLEFHVFEEADIERVTPVMKAAFDEDTRRHLNRPSGGPDGYDDGQFLRKYALHPDSQAYTIMKNGDVIGAVILWIRQHQRNHLGCLFIAPEVQDLGLGLTVWQFIEQHYSETVKWSTETPGFSRRNHHFYVNKCGFKIVRIDQPKDAEESSYYMEKVMN